MAALIVLAGVALPGCFGYVPAEKFQDVQRQLLVAQERIKSLETEVAAQQESVRALTQQLHDLRGVEGDPAETLIVPEQIKLAGMSGGYDEDGKVGDDGIVLYIQPIDRDGHVVKAAGMMKVRLLDPANPRERVVVADYFFDVPTTRSLWYGRLMTNHFRVRCPWPNNRPPDHRRIAADVVFTEILTGRSLTASETFEITFPANHPTTQ